MKLLVWITAAILVTLTAFMLLTAGWERPPIDSEQTGFRGTGMAHISNPRIATPLLEEQLAAVPASQPPPPGGGPTAGQIYQNVQLLGHLSVAEFNHLKQAWTDWIAPEEGCAHCHNLANMASDEVYTKVVSRRMLEMNWTINEDWGTHVGDTGVTCYTCHRGQNVPEYVWFASDPSEHTGRGMLGWTAGQNAPAEDIGLTSLPADPFSALISDGDESIRVVGRTVLPQGEPIGSTQDNERTFALMIHMSTALNVNCTYCHNTRNFSTWNQSPQERVTAWFGLEMTRLLNVDYVLPLSPVLPDHRLGPMGTGQQINCTTCHAGVPQPLGGLVMTTNYPSLLTRPDHHGMSLSQDEMDRFVSFQPDDEDQDEEALVEL